MRIAALSALWLFVSACAGSQAASSASKPAAAAAQSTPTVILASELQWEQLNPARGDKSPKAVNLWGDRKGPGATGFLVKFVDGFESPPHIHNVSYRGVVIEGLVHNDDPDADEMWMPPGSFWTQPKGDVHITAAKGEGSLTYIEIDEGPYLVRPVDEAFDAGEQPVNVDESNIAWRTPSNAVGGHEVALLWGESQDDRLNGSLIKLPAGASVQTNERGSTFVAVVVRGRLEHRTLGSARVQTMDPGSFLDSTPGAEHELYCQPGNDCVVYVRTQGKLDLVPAPPRATRTATGCGCEGR